GTGSRYRQAESIERGSAHSPRRTELQANQGGARMSFRSILSLLAALGMVSGLTAEVPKPATDDVQDFVFFADGRPLLIRAHVRVGDKSYRAVWDEYVTKVFKFLDTDGDGVLSQKEIDRMPPMQFITGNGLFGGRRPGLRNDVLVAHKDGKVT